MFETQAFRESLSRVVAAEAGRGGMADYRVAIIDYLAALAIQNERILMEQESRRSEGEQRGIPDALRSARQLISDASIIAANDGRKTLTEEDVQNAYIKNFCQVWPFCK